MGFNIKNNYGPNIEVNEGGRLTLVQGRDGMWHTVEAEEAEIVEGVTGDSVTDCGLESRLTGELASAEAEKYWDRLQAAGFVDKDCQLADSTTRKQAMYIAELFAEQLGIKSKWKTFEQLWGINNLAQEKWGMQETGTTPSRSKEIDKIFAD